MSRRTWVRAAVAIALVPPLLVLGSAGPSLAAEPSKLTPKLSITPQYTRVTGTKAATSRLAQTDKSLLGRTETTPVDVLVKLAYDSVATYAGAVAGYPATSPSVTGKPLTGDSNEKRYEGRIVAQENGFLNDLAKRVSGVKVGQRLRTVYGGVALRVPANRIADVLKIPGVVAVQKDELRKPLTDASPGFLGATSLYPQLGGAPNAGKGVIYGVLDTGAWPEHPSLADQGNLGAPPKTNDGAARVCDFGDNPLTPATDVFQCNDKVIGGQAFLQGYLSDPQRAADEVYHNARDSSGHGTHTATTAAGDVVSSAKVLGVERGPLNGIAPGAWVSAYKVCGELGCMNSDSAAAVQRAIKDGVNVINFSISGGTEPATDPVELAFLDAYAAGVFVAASAGNEGPGASTSNHLSPWVTAVAASTQQRAFESTLTVTGGDGVTATFTGASITDGVSAATPVVMSDGTGGYGDKFCAKAASAGSLNGKIVACARGAGVARVLKGYNVQQGGAVGMILYNPSLADIETDNHWLPAVHLADGTEFVKFMAAHPGVTATFTPGVKANGTGDVMAAFSSRGPGGNFIKPDVTAPGVEILAGNSPTPEDVTLGPAGQYYMAIAGTSMSSPHVAGSALLLKALHPDWSPGQIKSALMTTATTKVVKEDLTTPADPFDLGAGRIQDNVAANPGLTFDESAKNMAALGNDPVNAVQLNIPSVNAPVMPGKLTAVRVAKNVSGRTQSYRVQTTAPAGSSITVSPSAFTVAAGKTVTLRVTISSTAPTAQYFGEVRLVPVGSGVPTLHLPVAFVPKQGEVTLAQSCTPDQLSLFGAGTCTVRAQNNSYNDTTVSLETKTTDNLVVTGANGAKVTSPFTAERKRAPLAGAQPAIPSLQAGEVTGYIPLDSPDNPPIPVGDEDVLNVDLAANGLPPMIYDGDLYTKVGIDSNGYLVAGGAGSEDNECCNIPAFPNPARPNNFLAPFWTDLDGTNAPGIVLSILSDDAGNNYLAVEWRVNVFGTDQLEVFEVFLRLAGSETDRAQQIWFSYKPGAIVDPSTVGDPNQTFAIGAENINGSGGGQLPVGTLPTGDLQVISTDPVPGATLTYTVTVRGVHYGTGKVTTSMVTAAVPGTTVVSSPLPVHRTKVKAV